MSFSVDLWNSYDFVDGNLALHIRGLKDFIVMMKEKVNCTKVNSQSLRGIFSLNYAVSTFESLNDGVMCFRSDLINESGYLDEFCIGITDEIIKPMEELYKQFTNKRTALHNEAKGIINNYENCGYKLEQSQTKYYNAAQKAELSKVKANKLKNDNSITKEMSNKLAYVAWDDLKNAKEAESNYLLCLTNANGIRDNYIETMKRIMTTYQEIEEELAEGIKDSLRKYVIYQVAIMRNMQYDFDKKAKVMEAIDTKGDIRGFINKYANNEIYPYKFEYVPYESTQSLNVNQSMNDSMTNDNSNNTNKMNNSFSQSDMISNVQSFISNVLLNESSPERNKLQNETNTSIDNLIKVLFHNTIEINTKQKGEINLFLSIKKTRKIFLKGINDIRSTGNFILTEASYNLLGNSLFNYLEKINQERDYVSIKTIINLSLALYIIDNKPNMPRIFLQNALVNHSLWSRKEIWIELIKDSIIDEMHNQKAYNIYLNETLDQKSIRIKEVILSQLHSFLYNMISYELDSQLMLSIIEYIFFYYDIKDKDKKQEAVQLINDFNQKNKRK